MTDFPDLKVKALLTYPSSVIGGVGVETSKSNGKLVVDLAFGEFGEVSAIPTSPTSSVLTYDPADDSYVRIPSSLLGGAVAGISDAPVNSVLYGRKNAAWSPVPVVAPGIPEAPTDGGLYGRQASAWALVPASTGIGEAPNDGLQYARQSLGWHPVTGGGFGGPSTDNAIARYNGIIGVLQDSTPKISDGGTISIAPTAASLTQGFDIAQSAAGTQEKFDFNKILISSDNVAAGASVPSEDFVNGLFVDHSFGGSAAKGGRNAIFGKLSLTAATNAANPYNFNAALLGWAFANVTDAGASMYGAGATALVASGATVANVIGAEFTVGIASGGASAVRSALILNGLGGTGVQGSTTDALCVLCNQTSTTAKFKYGILVTDLGSANCDPIDHGIGVIFSAKNVTALHGIDLSNSTFGGGAYKSPGFSVDGSGTIASQGGIGATGVILTGSQFQALSGGGGSATGLKIRNTTISTAGVFFFPGASAPTAAVISFGDGTGWNFKYQRQNDNADLMIINDDKSVAVKGNFTCAPSSSVTPVNNGDLVFQLTSNTSLTFKVKGSDGVVRSGSLALA